VAAVVNVPLVTHYAAYRRGYFFGLKRGLVLGALFGVGMVSLALALALYLAG
jgi:hypothetical protein